MSSLTETAYITRKFVKFGLIGFVGFLVVRALLIFSVNYYKRLHPPPPPPPDKKFGMLPDLKFPSNLVETSKLEFKLETAMGGLPDLPDRSEVYFIPHARSNLQAAEKAKQQASKMGFITELEKDPNSTLHTYQDTHNPPMSLTIDEVSNNVNMTYDYKNDQSLLLEKSFTTNKDVLEAGVRMLEKSGLKPNDMALKDARLVYYRLGFPDLVEAPSISEADFVRVNFVRGDINGLPVVYANPNKTNVSVLVSGSNQEDKRVVELNYYYYPVKTEVVGTYPLQNVQTAYIDLKKGDAGYVASLNPQTKQVVIRDVYLGYYDPPDAQDYLQPVFVFEGDNNAKIYIPAVSKKWRKIVDKTE